MVGAFAQLGESLLKASSTVGGYAGVIGGMMGEIFANGAPSQSKYCFDLLCSFTFNTETLHFSSILLEFLSKLPKLVELCYLD